MAIKELKACDIVDDGALTTKLFSKKKNTPEKEKEEFKIIKFFKKLIKSDARLSSVKRPKKKNEMKDFQKQFQKELKVLSGQIKELKKSVNTGQEKFKELKAENKKLKAKLLKYSKKPASHHSDGKLERVKKKNFKKGENSWMSNPVNQKLLKKQK